MGLHLALIPAGQVRDSREAAAKFSDANRQPAFMPPADAPALAVIAALKHRFPELAASVGRPDSWDESARPFRLGVVFDVVIIEVPWDREQGELLERAVQIALDEGYDVFCPEEGLLLRAINDDPGSRVRSFVGAIQRALDGGAAEIDRLFEERRTMIDVYVTAAPVASVLDVYDLMSDGAAGCEPAPALDRFVAGLGDGTAGVQIQPRSTRCVAVLRLRREDHESIRWVRTMAARQGLRVFGA